FFFFSSRRRHTRSDRDWSSDVCSSDLYIGAYFGWCYKKWGRSAPAPLLNLAVGGTTDAAAAWIEKHQFDVIIAVHDTPGLVELRSEERRVGKERRSQWSPDAERQKEGE